MTSRLGAASVPEPPKPGRGHRVAWSRWRGPATVAAALAIALVALTLEVGFEGHDPLWLDESWTGAIVGQPSWRAVFQQIYWDVNAPLYYLLIGGWGRLSGLSDLALRAPSLVAAALIPLAAALWPAPGVSRGTRLAWAGTLAWWFPALCFAQEARCYALLLAVCTLQTLAFVRLIAVPGRREATIWAALASLAILVHYDALYLAAIQGVLFLASRRTAAVRTWPAALAFVPAFGWLTVHWPRIRQFARPDIAWYSPLRLSDLHGVAAYALGGGGIELWLLAALAVSATTLRFALPAQALGRRKQDAGPAWLAVVAAVLAALVLLAMGFARPSFTLRYLTPCAPGLLLGVTLALGGLAGRRWRPWLLAGLAASYLFTGVWMLAHRLRMAPRRYNFEAASAALQRTHPSRLVFLWDHPVDPILHPEQLSALGGFFLHRAGRDIPVTPVVLKPGEDPNRRLVLEAAAQRGSAILWLYDTVVKGTAATTHPPAITQTDPSLACRQYGNGRFGVLACVRRADAAASDPAKAHQRGIQAQGSM